LGTFESVAVSREKFKAATKDVDDGSWSQNREWKLDPG
jgi:hypothetical protein